MSHDVFISYSSKDHEKAEQLTQMLSSAGLSVWIDRSALEVSASWSAEIVDAITSCSAFIVLLSPNSIESHNVIKEVSLAFEKRKKILPLELEPIALPRELEYQLAGIHRTSMANIDSIIRALGKLGLEATQAPTLKLVTETDSRKSLMILPFDDLSPTGDNQWFADGLATELISTLSNIKSLRVTDQQTTKEFKSFKGHLTTYAKEMSIRYFIQGSVRKFGDQIKITSSLLDIETGDNLWQDSLKGTMEDIFDIQETVATKVAEGLRIILTEEERRNVDSRPTENTEAYELYLKGNEYYLKSTRTDLDHALRFYEEATRLDPNFVGPHLSIANTALAIFRNYSRDEKWAYTAEKHISLAQSLLGETAQIYRLRSSLAYNLGQYEEALSLAKESIRLDPSYGNGYSALGFAYSGLGLKEEALNARERELQLRENDIVSHFSYFTALNEIGDPLRLEVDARKAIPIYERHLRLNPDDVNARIQYAIILSAANQHAEAVSEARNLEQTYKLDGLALYNLACLYLKEGNLTEGIRLLKKSIEHGYRNLQSIRSDRDLDPIRELPEFNVIVNDLGDKIKQEKNS